MFNFIIGERGVGKTYGAIKFCINDYLKNGNQFVYVRRFKTEIESSADAKDNSFFAKIEENKDSGLCKASWKSPEGKSVLAVWSYKNPVATKVSVGGKYQILDIFGKSIKGDALKDICKKNSADSLELNATASVIYIVSEK